MSIKSLYEKTPVPLPSQPLILPPHASLAEVCGALDTYFDDIVGVYAPRVRAVLKKMYHEDVNVETVGGLLETGKQARAALHPDGRGGYAPVVEVDRRLAECPVLYRCLKMHEVGGHIGQILARWRIAGIRGMLEELREGAAITRFLEQSIAPAEKEVLDALPPHIIDADLMHIEDGETRGSVSHFMKRDKDMDYDDYARLKHRAGSCPYSATLTEDAHALLHNRPDVAAFSARMRARAAMPGNPTPPRTFPTNPPGWRGA